MKESVIKIFDEEIVVNNISKSELVQMLFKLSEREKAELPIEWHAVHDGIEISKYECPECGNLLTPDYDYCSSCGQKIDWRRK